MTVIGEEEAFENVRGMSGLRQRSELGASAFSGGSRLRTITFQDADDQHPSQRSNRVAKVPDYEAEASACCSAEQLERGAWRMGLLKSLHVKSKLNGSEC